MATSPSRRHLRKKPIQARSRQTVKSILEAADRVLRRDGYDAASTNRIAQIAGYSVGSLYQYFADKESVVRTLIDQSLAVEDELVGDCLAKGAGEPLGQALGALVEFLLQSRWTDAHVHRTLESECGELYGQSALARVLEAQSVFPTALQQLAVKHWPGLRRDDVGAALWVLMAATQAVTFQAAVNPQPDVTLASLVQHVGEAWNRALKAPASEHPLVEELAPLWQQDSNSSPVNALAAAHRLAELRALLLRSSSLSDPARFAPAAFALACLPSLAALPASARPGVSDEALDRELRVFASALLETCLPPAD
ncbi:MAG: TetR/AcrR family transcriptional regulator [bacterium]|nr:TetR/AcrR family transcriptional regulator [bacterium]